MPLYNQSLSRRQFGSWALGLIASAAALEMETRLPRGSSAHLAPTSDQPADAFLKDQSRQIIDSARLRAGQAAGSSRNSTAFDMHVPGGNMGYPAFWVRDAVMMLGGDFIPAAEIEGWIRLICSTLRREDWQVRPGVVVPAFAVPDHINFDGKASFYPGSYESGDKQGGHPWGKYPPLDDGFYFLMAVHEHWRLTRDLGLLNSRLRTAVEELPLSDICERVYRAVPCGEKTGLVIAGGVDSENAKDWGFCDSVFKSGKLLFPSLLKFVAAKRMREVFEAAGNREKAAFFGEEAVRLRGAIVPTFLRAPEDGETAWLHSATGVGNQPDVWGSAFAVHCGALEVAANVRDDPPPTPPSGRGMKTATGEAPPARDGAAALQVSRMLVKAYREGTIAREGFVRHLPTSDKLNGGGWERSVSGLGEYQNGGYWGTPVGWCISAMHRSDPAAAAQLGKDYITTLRAHVRPDGMAEAWEWRNPDIGKSANPLYVATVALPYLSLKEAGLLSVLRSE